MVGLRVAAWKGEKDGQCGTVIRVDGVTHCFVLWDDGEMTHYYNSWLTRPEWLREKSS